MDRAISTTGQLISTTLYDIPRDPFSQILKYFETRELASIASTTKTLRRKVIGHLESPQNKRLHERYIASSRSGVDLFRMQSMAERYIEKMSSILENTDSPEVFEGILAPEKVKEGLQLSTDELEKKIEEYTLNLEKCSPLYFHAFVDMTLRCQTPASIKCYLHNTLLALILLEDEFDDEDEFDELEILVKLIRYYVASIPSGILGWRRSVAIEKLGLWIEDILLLFECSMFEMEDAMLDIFPENLRPFSTQVLAFLTEHPRLNGIANKMSKVIPVLLTLDLFGSHLMSFLNTNNIATTLYSHIFEDITCIVLNFLLYVLYRQTSFAIEYNELYE